MRTLYITYGTQTYKAAVEDDTYVRVDGTRWNISVDDDGVVTLDMADITENGNAARQGGELDTELGVINPLDSVVQPAQQHLCRR